MAVVVRLPPFAKECLEELLFALRLLFQVLELLLVADCAEVLLADIVVILICKALIQFSILRQLSELLGLVRCFEGEVVLACIVDHPLRLLVEDHHEELLAAHGADFHGFAQDLFLLLTK